MADCMAAEVARGMQRPLATADPALLDVCRAEGIGYLALPASAGTTWTPTATENLHNELSRRWNSTRRLREPDAVVLTEELGHRRLIGPRIHPGRLDEPLEVTLARGAWGEEDEHLGGLTGFHSSDRSVSGPPRLG